MTEPTPRRIEDVLAEEGVYVSATSGISMLPLLREGRDTVLIRPAEGRLKKYDVALYRAGGRYVLHRVIGVRPDGYVIRGDNCVARELVRDGQILGVLDGVWRGEEELDLHSPRYRRYVRVRCALAPVRIAYQKCRARAAAAAQKLFGKNKPAV